MEYEVGGSRPRGRPKRTWKEVVREDCQARKLNKEDAMDRCNWRKVILKYVDQDGCERVNVSSGTGLPHKPSDGVIKTCRMHPQSQNPCSCSYDLERTREVIKFPRPFSQLGRENPFPISHYINYYTSGTVVVVAVVTHVNTAVDICIVIRDVEASSLVAKTLGLKLSP